MTQEELGNRLGVQKSAIRKYEKGIVDNIPRNRIALMAEIFGVDPVWLMGFDDEQDHQSEAKQAKHDAYKLVQTFLKLNDVGQAKAIEYLSDLADNAKYTEGREGAKQKLA